MDYYNNYYDYINYVKKQNRHKEKHYLPNGLLNTNFVYYEEHHIIPRCIGGTDEKENLILLTAREHFLAHYILCKIYKDYGNFYYKLVNAFIGMQCRNPDVRYTNSHLYENYKKQYIEILSKRMKGKQNLLGHKHSLETRKKLSISRKGKTPSLGYHHLEETKNLLREYNKNVIIIWNDQLNCGKKVHVEELEYYIRQGYRLGTKHPSQETKDKLRILFIGRVVSDETRKKQSESAKGKPKSKETIEKIKETKRNKKYITSEETKKKLSEVSKNTKWINNGIISKMVKEELVDSYLSSGWLLGRLKKEIS